MEFLIEMEKIASSPGRIKSYAERQAIWLLPCLIGKSTRHEEKEESINPTLLEDIDKEMDEHMENKMKRRGKEPQKKTTTFKKAKPKNLINYLRIIFIDVFMVVLEAEDKFEGPQSLDFKYEKKT